VPNDHPLSPGGATLAILDANVLLPPRLSDLLFDLALEGLYHPRWTQTIESEFIANFAEVVLAKDKKERKAMKAATATPEHIHKAMRRLQCFRSAVGPAYEVLLYDKHEYQSKVPLSVHAGDVHVASAALVLQTLAQDEGVADRVLVVSDNLAHLAVAAMAAKGISVVSPGNFIDLLNAAAPARVENALQKTISDLEAPPFSHEDLLRLLVNRGAKDTATFYAAIWGLDIAPSRLQGRLSADRTK